MTKTTAAEILANPATRRRQVTMTISFPPDQPGVLAAASPLLAVRAPNDARSCEGIADRSIAPREAPLIAGLSLSFHQAEFFELGVCEGALFLLSAV